MLKHHLIRFGRGIFFLALSGCDSFLGGQLPQTQLTTQTVFEDPATATAALAGVYTEMISGPGFASGGNGSISVLCGLSSDEFINFSPSADQVQFYQNTLTPLNSYVRSSLWQPAYKYIYYLNACIQGLDASASLSAELKQRLDAEARFLRAFCYFNLVGLFGDVPLITTTDYAASAVAVRADRKAVYAQIIRDLGIAVAALPTAQGSEKVRATQWAAAALLARVYLYAGDWENARKYAGLVLESGRFTLEADLDKAFLALSREAIWQLRPVLPGSNTNEATVFISTSLPASVALSADWLSAFDSGDLRKKHWIKSVQYNGVTYYFPFKYKVRESGQPLSEYSIVLRLAEQYLIRSEASYQLADYQAAADDLNVVRLRAGLPRAVFQDPGQLYLAIQKERSLELLSEWGHRWMDLNRWALSDQVLSPLKKDWKPQARLYPLPQTELAANPALVQNPGY